VPDYVRRLRVLVGGEELLQLPSVSIALRDADGRILLARHAEGNVWLLPGGGIEPGETPADAAVREMFEETGLIVRLTRLVGVFGGPEFIVRYRKWGSGVICDGDLRSDPHRRHLAPGLHRTVGAAIRERG
jgi:8-oxo-dGTP pyrophosphatase MutT (NUDIX family)